MTISKVGKSIDSASRRLTYLKGVESRARTYANDFPILIERGENSTVFDSDGRAYIDCLAGAGTLALGHNHPRILQALHDFLETGQILHGLDLATPVKVEFTRCLLDCFPNEFSQRARVQFCGPTGADAVEAAIKLFKTATGRSTVCAFQGAYHGMSQGTLSLTGNIGPKQGLGSLLPDVCFLPFPYAYRCPFGIGGSQGIDVGLRYIESTLSDPNSGIKKPAALIVEIVQGEGGCIPADDRWVRGLRELTRRLDVPLIVDEIQTGFGRTGHMFAFESSGIIPDAVVVSKALGGGLPISALVYDQRYDVWSPGAHAGTFRGNQLAMAAGIATIRMLREEKLIDECRKKGDFLLGKLRALQQTYAIIGDVRGRGLMVGLEVVDPRKPRDEFGRLTNSPELTRKVKQACLERGLIIESGGRHNSVLRLLPPLIIGLKELECVLERLDGALRSVTECTFDGLAVNGVRATREREKEINVEVRS